MAVRKPLQKFQEYKEEEIEKLIAKGASVREDLKREEKKFTNLNLRMPTEMLKKVNDALQERIGISRNGWILEAIQEKLREGNERKD